MNKDNEKVLRVASWHVLLFNAVLWFGSIIFVFLYSILADNLKILAKFWIIVSISSLLLSLIGVLLSLLLCIKKRDIENIFIINIWTPAIIFLVSVIILLKIIGGFE